MTDDTKDTFPRRFCENCANCVIPLKVTGISIYPDYEHAACYADEVVALDPDFMVAGRSGALCRELRQLTGRCGLSARYFVQKPPRRQPPLPQKREPWWRRLLRVKIERKLR